MLRKALLGTLAMVGILAASAGVASANGYYGHHHHHGYRGGYYRPGYVYGGYAPRVVVAPPVYTYPSPVVGGYGYGYGAAPGYYGYGGGYAAPGVGVSTPGFGFYVR